MAHAVPPSILTFTSFPSTASPATPFPYLFSSLSLCPHLSPNLSHLSFPTGHLLVPSSWIIFPYLTPSFPFPSPTLFNFPRPCQPPTPSPMTVPAPCSKEVNLERVAAENSLSSLRKDPELILLDPILMNSSAESLTDSGSEDSGNEAQAPPTPTSLSSLTSKSSNDLLASLALECKKALAIPSKEWKTLIRHRPSGMEVSRYHPSQGRHSIYRGQLDICDATPSQIWSVVKEKSLWDDWYVQDDHLTDLGPSSSLTRLIMKPPVPGVNARDFCLLENLTMPTPDEILFSSTSHPSPSVPVASGHVRGHLSLHVFHLTPFSAPRGKGTRLTYLIQLNPQSWIPRSLTRAIMARRPLVLLRIHQHLQGKCEVVSKGPSV